MYLDSAWPGAGVTECKDIFKLADNTETPTTATDAENVKTVETVQEDAQAASAVSEPGATVSTPTDTADEDTDTEPETTGQDDESGDVFDKFKRELSKKNSENQTLRQRAKDSEARAQQAEMKLLRREVADELKIPAVLADRLHGASREELVKDAEALLEGLRGLPLMGLVPRIGGTQLGDSVESSSSFNGNYDELAASIYK